MSPASNVMDPLRDGPTSSTTLIKALQLSQPTLSRALTTLQREGRVLKMGATRGARYGLLRTVPGAGNNWPVYQVDATGKVREVGRLHALMPRHFHFESERRWMRGLTEGLPWFLSNQRPSGFLGEGLCAESRPADATEGAGQDCDDRCLAWSVQAGWDCAGDLIAGAEAYEDYLESAPLRRAVTAADRAGMYPGMAEEILATRHSVAQLGGVQPKFTVLADHGGHMVQALVKFSPPLDSPEGQRWGDLLMAEHLAHQHLNSRGVGAVHSRVYRYGGRIFLEIDRFDRVGVEGRRGTVTLAALQVAGPWPAESWTGIALRLSEAGSLPKNDARQIRTIEAFARLIGNTDLGLDNLSLFDSHDGRFALAPVYDMLPMLFAPGVPGSATMAYEPPQPTAETLEVWPHARRIAESYWEKLASEPQLSAGFRALCAGALAALRATPG